MSLLIYAFSYYKAQNQFNITIGIYDEDGYIFIRKDGTPINPNSYTKVLILGGTMVFLGWRAIFVYLPIIIEDLGGTSADFGNAMAIINASSIIGMLTYPFFRKKLGLKAILILGCFAMALRWALTAIAPTLIIITIVQALESFGFGFAQPAMIESISHMARENDRSSLITIWTGTMMALGTILANIVVQVVSAKTGLQLSFMEFTVLAIVGMGIVLSGCKE